MKFYKILVTVLIVIIYSCNTAPKIEEGYIEEENQTITKDI